MTYVETHGGQTGRLNADLLHPHADTTYVVDGRHVFHTDHLARTDHVHVDNLSFHDADRSPKIQSKVGNDAGVGYEGGHLIARMFGGTPEYHNLVGMLESVNRGSGNSFGNLEKEWAGLLRKDPSTNIIVDVRPHYLEASTVPDKIEVRYTIDGSPHRRIFKNV